MAMLIGHAGNSALGTPIKSEYLPLASSYERGVEEKKEAEEKEEEEEEKEESEG